jgi:predicted permease
MNALWHDIRFALRALLKRPLYMVVTVFVLALAIGANATVFSVFHGLFLKPLPYPEDDRLVFVYNTYPRMGLEFAGTSIPDYLDRREQAPSLEDLAIYTTSARALGTDGTPERITVPVVSPSLFDVLGIRPQLGRTFTEEEATPGNDRVVVLSHTLWQTRFGGRADILGTDVRLDGDNFRVIGIMPPEFIFPNANVRAWVPFAFTPEQMSDSERGNEYSNAVGRLKPGATIEGLNGEMAAIIRRNIERLGEAAEFIEQTGFSGRAESMREFTVGNLRPMLLVLQASVLAVLLIACANVANLQLARIAARRKELTIRAVLGAQQRRLATLVLTESAVLAALGALFGLAIAHFGLALVRTLGLDRASQGFEYSLDPMVIVFTAGAALFAAVISALIPVVVLLRDQLAQSINEAGRLGGGGRAAQLFRNGLVVAQIAMSAALLVGAGLLTKSFYQLQQQGTGFDYERVLTARISLPANRFADMDAQGRLYQQGVEALRALPGVVDAGFTTVLPFTGSNSQATINVDGYTPPEGSPQPHAQIRSIDERYLRTLEIPVVRGRGFEAHEPDRVVIIDENMARRFWPEGNALGQRLRRSTEDDDVWYTVVGVVPAVRHDTLADEATKETVYWHYRQRAEPFGVFALRTAVPPQQLERLLRDTMATIDPELPLFDVMPFATRVENSLGPQRTPMVLTLVFGAVAFMLAVVGVYGVLTWAVTQRFGEIGVRMALGARGADIVRLVVGQGSRMTLVGLGIGLLAALALGRLMASQLHGTSALDPMIFSVVIAGLAAAALLASWLPARRAAGIDPMNALRTE